MTTQITKPDEIFQLSPEALEFTQKYLETLDLDATAKYMQISRDQAAKFLRKKEVKKFIDSVFLEQGYMNRFKLVNLLETVIKSKLDEAEESGIYTNKDLIDVLKLMHEIRKDEIKLLELQNGTGTPGKQTNVQVNNYGDNLSNLISSLMVPKNASN